MPNPYRTASGPSPETEEWEPDPMRRHRRAGIALAVACSMLLVALVPLVGFFFLVQPATAAFLWLSTALAAVLAGLSSAHLLFEARRGDRTRAQTLCGWLAAAALVLAAVGVIAIVAGVLVGGFVASLEFPRV